MEARVGDAPSCGVVFDVGGTLTLSPHGTPFVGTDAEAASARPAVLGHEHDRDAFDPFLTSDALRRRKAHPRGFEAVLEAWELPPRAVPGRRYHHRRRRPPPARGRMASPRSAGPGALPLPPSPPRIPKGPT